MVSGRDSGKEVFCVQDQPRQQDQERVPRGGEPPRNPEGDDWYHGWISKQRPAVK